MCTLNFIPDLQTALATLQHIRGRVHSVEGKEKLNYLTNLFNNQQFQNAVSVHHKVLNVKTQDPPAKSTCSNSQDILHETSEGLTELETPQSDELVKLLNKPHVKVGIQMYRCCCCSGILLPFPHISGHF